MLNRVCTNKSITLSPLAAQMGLTRDDARFPGAVGKQPELPLTWPWDRYGVI